MTSSKKAIWIILITLGVVVFLNSSQLLEILRHNVSFDWLTFAHQDIALERASRAAASKGDIKIGILGPWEFMQKEKGYLKEGIILGIEEVNQTRNRKLVPVFKDTERNLLKAEEEATALVNDLDIPIVVGPWASGVVLSTMPLFQYGGTLNLLPDATSDKVSALGFKNMFRFAPKSSQFAKALAAKILKDKINKVSFINFNNSYADNLTDVVENELNRLNIETVFRIEYDQYCEDGFFDKTFDQLVELYPSDAIFVVANVPKWIEVIQWLRKKGINPKSTSRTMCLTMILCSIPNSKG